MMLKTLIPVLLLFICPAVVSAQDTSTLNQAVQLYQAGQFQKSIELLQAQPTTKESAFVLMLNYMKLGDSMVTKNDTLAQDYLQKALKYSNQCDQ